MKKLLLTLVLLAGLAQVAKAQYDVHFSNYWDLRSYYNPASSGDNDRINIKGTYSMQLLGYDNAPKSMYFGGDLPFKMFNKKHGAGVGFFSETIGMFTNQNFWVQYAFKQPIGKGVLSAGVKVGALTVAFDPEGIILGDENVDDPAFPTSKVDGMSVDLGAGIYYSHPLFWVGASASHLTSPSVELGESGDFRVSPVFYFMSGGNIKTKNPLISIQPSLLLETDFVAYRCDITARVTYSNNGRAFYGGIGYSPMTSVSFMFGAKIKDFTLGYAYDMYTSNVGLGSGSHDIVLGYSFEMNFSKKGKNKHKSIRIL